MNTPEDLPEPDRVEGAPHPRETTRLVGQQAAEAAFLEAFNAGRLHHGWLITGPRGVGKATLAWRIARFLLATDPAADTPQGLDIPRDHPVARRMAALAEPRLFLLRRAWDEQRKRLKQVITVDEVRKLGGFFHLSATDGGRRVVIVDSADEMNPSAANALLKLLEEPPAGAVLLLVSHQPSRLLPTIRSRCRELRCPPLPPADLARAVSAANGDDEGATPPQALAALSGGSVGEALRLSGLGGMETYTELVALFSTLPRLDRPRALKLAESAAGPRNAERFDLLLRLVDLFLTRTARTGVTGPPLVEAASGEGELMQRLSPDAAAARAWAELQQQLSTRARHGQAVNLDPAALLLDMFLRINETASRLAAR